MWKPKGVVRIGSLHIILTKGDEVWRSDETKSRRVGLRGE